MPSPFTATRYHSLTIDPGTVPPELEVTGRTAGGVVMAVRHRDLTQGGHRLLANWLVRCGDPDAVARSRGMAPLVRT